MPFKSEAQRRKFHVLESEGKMSKAEVDKWESETPDKRSLPYHKGGAVSLAYKGKMGPPPKPSSTPPRKK